MAGVILQLPTILHAAAAGQGEIALDVQTLEDALGRFCQMYPDAGRMIFDEHGDLYSHVMVYRNLQPQPWQDSKAHHLADGDEITLVLAVAGGV